MLCKCARVYLISFHFHVCCSEPHESTESDKSNDTAATDEIYADFLPPADTHPDCISIVDPNSDVDFIVDSSSDTGTADKNLVLVADDPDDPDFVLQTCNDTETSSNTTNQRSDVISTSLEIEEIANIPRTEKKAVTVFKTAPDTDDSLYDFEPVLKRSGHEVDVEMLMKRSFSKKDIKEINLKSDNAKSALKGNFAIERTKKETMEIWYESDTMTTDTLEDSISPKNGKFVGFNDSEGSEEMKYFDAAERILNFPGRPYESTEHEQSKDSASASTAESSKDDSKDRRHSEKEITERSSETDVEETLTMNGRQTYNTTVNKTEEKEINCEQGNKKEADTAKGYEDQERLSHVIVDSSDSENFLEDLDEDESKTAFKQLLQKKLNLSTREINRQKYVETGSSPKTDSPFKSGGDSVEISPSSKWDLLKDLPLEETELTPEETGLSPAKVDEENKETENVETGLSPAKVDEENKETENVETGLSSTKVNEQNKETETVEIIYNQTSENTRIKFDTNTSEKPDENANNATVEENYEVKDVAEVPGKESNGKTESEELDITGETENEINGKTESEELDITGETENEGIRNKTEEEENSKAKDVAEVPEEEINGKTESEELDITGESENEGIRNKTEEEQSKDNADEAQDQKEDDDDLIVLKHEPVRFSLLRIL